MASNTVYTESVVTLNNQEVTARLDEIRQKAAEVRKEMWEMAKAKGPDSKEFRALQKELVSLANSEKSLNEETKRFEKVIRDLSGASMNELQSAMRKLQQQMRRTKPDTKEFYAYAEQLKSVRTRMRELESQSRAAQKVLGGFFSKIGWAGLITGAIAGIRKFGSDMIAQTQLIGDKWKFETAGWKAAYGSFVADLSSGRGWNELVQRMKDAYKNGKQVAAMLDEIFERSTSLQITTAELNLEAAKQRKLMMDTTLSTKKRIAAAEEYDTLMLKIAEEEKAVAQQKLEAYELELRQRTKMSEAEYRFFIDNYNANLDIIHQAQEYTDKIDENNKAIKDLQKSYNLMDSAAQAAASNIIEQINALKAENAALEQQTDETTKSIAGLVRKYQLGNDEMVKNYGEAKTATINADIKYEQATTKSSKQAATLRKQLANEAKAAQDKAYQDAVKKSDEHFKQLKNQAKQAYADGQISQEEYNARIAAIDESSLKDRIALGERYKQSVIDLQSQLLDLSVKQKQELEKMADDLNAALLKQIEETNKAIDDEAQATCDELSEDFVKRWSEMLDKAQEISRELNPMIALKEEMGEEMESLQTLLENNLITEEEFQKKRLEIVRRYAARQAELMTEPYAKGIQTAQKYVEQVSSFTEALQSAAAARMEAQMQAELTAAGDNAEKREEIEAGYEQRKLDLQKRYANINMGIEIAKAIAAGALAIMQGFAELGPIGGAVSAALIAATTAVQVATIVAQRNAIMNSSVDTSRTSSSSSVTQRVATGFSKGGFTEKRPNDYEPVGVVHANEWVAPAAMVRANPIVFSTLEQMRASGNYRSGVAGFADGGQAPGKAIQTPASDSAMDSELLRRTYELLSELKAALPFPTYLVLSQASAKMEVDNEIKKIVGKQ